MLRWIFFQYLYYVLRVIGVSGVIDLKPFKFIKLMHRPIDRYESIPTTITMCFNASLVW